MNKTSEFIGNLIAVMLVLLYFWGIGWSVHRGEYGQAVVSFVIPPYGAWRGAASFWDKPQWQENYDVRAEQIAIALEYATSTSRSDISQSVEDNHRLNNWLKKLPDEERAKLKEASQNYGAAIMGCSRTFAASLLNNHADIHPCKTPEVQQHVTAFQSITGFSNAWKKFTETTDSYAKNVAAKQQEISSQAKDGAQERLDANMKAVESKINSTISAIFN